MTPPYYAILTPLTDENLPRVMTYASVEGVNKVLAKIDREMIKMKFKSRLAGLLAGVFFAGICIGALPGNENLTVGPFVAVSVFSILTYFFVYYAFQFAMTEKVLSASTGLDIVSCPLFSFRDLNKDLTVEGLERITYLAGGMESSESARSYVRKINESRRPYLTFDIWVCAALKAMDEAKVNASKRNSEIEKFTKELRSL